MFFCSSRFIQEGKDVARQGDMNQALTFFKLAYKIHQSQELESRIKTIEELLAQNDSEEEDEEFVNVNGSGLMLFKELYDKLYDYQINGVAFLYSLCRDGRKGGILADDMGLGKTIQVISFLSGMYDNELAKHTLLVMPTSLITNWTKEFAKWTPGMRVKEFHGSSKERTRNLENIQRTSGVIITTYSMLMNNWQQLSSYNGKEFTWDYMILDEAHKIKSSTTKTAKSAYAIPSKNRVLLTGTPVQNNLSELWALFNFACHGSLLGTARTFKTEYENPITRAREKDTTPGEKALGSRMSENLMAIIKPYFLRRTKAEVQKNNKKVQLPCKEEYSETKDGKVQNIPKDSGAVMPTLTRKNDLIVWTYLSPVQEDIYRQFLSLDHIKELLMTTRSPLAELNIIKKLCDHPRLLSAAAIAKLGLEESTALGQQNNNMETDTCTIANIPDETLISESGKLVFLFALLQRLREEGHRTLVYAQYRKVLDIIERILGNRGFKVLRLDGTIIQLAERERLITEFQTDKSYSVFLLTTQVGGVGITLTAANRVVIYDPSWNPATDAQAVDRAYRIGQSKNVVVYRLITCGTVEEKIYRRQVFKDSLIRQNTGDKKNPFRYFSKQELKELFLLEDTRSSSTQLQLQSLHSRHRRTDAELDEHIAQLHTMEMFGISDHDLMFSLDVNHDDDPEDQEAHHYIEGRVQKAQELMKAESELQMQMAESLTSNTEPAWLRQPADNHIREWTHEKKPRNPKPSPSHPQHDSNSNGSPVVIELDQSGSDEGDGQQNLRGHVVDLIADEGMSEEHPVVEVSQDKLVEQNLYSPKHVSVKQKRSYLVADESSSPEVIEESLVVSVTSDAELSEMADASNQKLRDEVSLCGAANDSASDGSMAYVTAADEDEQLSNETSHSRNVSKTDLGLPHLTALQNKRLSVLQASTSSFKADTSSNVSTGLDSFGGNFNLQLEDSDMLSDHDELVNLETEEEETELLSQLQMEGSFNINKSLSEKQHKKAVSQSFNGNSSVMDNSMDNSIVTKKKKRAAVIDDSDQDDVDDRSHLDNSFQVLGASTPKLVSSVRTPLRSRKSVGGNTSVASCRSVILSIVKDMENIKDNQAITSEEEEEEDDVSERHSDEAEEDLIGSTHDELQVEETHDTEGKEDVEEEEADVQGEESEQEMTSNMEQSTSEPELASDEQMDQCTADGVKLSSNGILSKEESFGALVRRGKEYQSKGKPDDALSCFLRAIDIQPGDPEVQLMTIQLYRQLSQRS
ncbi:DNA excision repair protein ERCC-6-like [Trematomus bernacchii]|uniref:DNA excision repair protein ERCC-6-like n=1 Tax=Trematomus bernacchii TaxID=40690 RepID=UPI00146B6B2E|nr:DNA excision repair protein ERCC-6-like [Trematomus bernacchii]